MPTARLACLVLCNAADWALMLQVFSGFARSLHVYLSQQRRDCRRQQHWPPAPLCLSPSLPLCGWEGSTPATRSPTCTARWRSGARAVELEKPMRVHAEMNYLPVALLHLPFLDSLVREWMLALASDAGLDHRERRIAGCRPRAKVETARTFAWIRYGCAACCRGTRQQPDLAQGAGVG